MPGPSSASHVAHRPLAALGVIGAAIVTLACTISAIAYEGSEGQRYSLLNHWISELGEVAHSELAWVFNLGMIVAGPMLAVFMAALGRIIGGGWGGAIAVAGVVAGIGGLFVGLFPMDQAREHGLAALTFLVAGPVAVGLFTAWLIHERPSDVPRSLVIPGMLTVVAFVTFLALVIVTGDGSLGAPEERPLIWPIALFEWLTLIGLLAWVVGVSAVLWQGHPPDGP